MINLIAEDNLHSNSVINIIVPCTNRKTNREVPQQRFRDFNCGSAKETVPRWIRAVDYSPKHSVPASTLYSGDHWYVVRSIYHQFGNRSNIWICSAGYGLIPFNAPIRPYSCTFTPNHPDSVTFSGKAAEKKFGSLWWKALSKWEGPVPGSPRTIQDIARENPSSPILVNASSHYLLALKDDLIAARGELDSPDRLMIISAGLRGLDGLSSSVLPCDARFQGLVDGARVSLNVRIARLLLSSTDLSNLRFDSALVFLKQLLENLPEVTKYERRKATDEEVTSFIESRLQARPKETPTSLLRQFRSSGRACEQSRFSRLFKAYEEVRNGG
jgi:hypothetical protein